MLKVSGMFWRYTVYKFMKHVLANDTFQLVKNNLGISGILKRNALCNKKYCTE